jgi:hypothetical protein
MHSPSFIPGLELSAGFFADHVGPLLAQGFPDLRYSAALIGTGSEVLGFDTPLSTDHHWGPRVMLFLRPGDYGARRDGIRAYLSEHLPSRYRGYSTHFTAPNPDDHGVQHLAPHTDGPINHRVDVLTLDAFLRSYLGLEIGVPMTAADWLSLPSQKLRSIVAGAVFHDDLGLEAVRERLAWYPADVGRYLLGCLWTRIGQEEHLMGRAGDVQDEIGSALIGARLVRDLMRLAFHLERQYPPYPKWFGTAFGRLACAATLRPHLEAALQARTWPERERGLVPAYEIVAELQRAAEPGADLPGRASDFWGRPFRVIHGGKIAEALFSRIADAQLRSLARSRPIGSIDLISDSTDVLENTSLAPLVRALYRA